MIDTKPIVFEEPLTLDELGRMIFRLENRLVERMDKGFALVDKRFNQNDLAYEQIFKRFDDNDVAHSHFKKELDANSALLSAQISGLNVYYPSKEEHNALKTRVTRVERKLQIP